MRGCDSGEAEEARGRRKKKEKVTFCLYFLSLLAAGRIFFSHSINSGLACILHSPGCKSARQADETRAEK